MKSPHLTFEWPTRHRIHILLPVMVVLAALAHGAVFFLFAVRQPAPRPGGPNPAQVYFLAPGSAPQLQLAALLNAMDPALFAPGRGLPSEVPIDVVYTPKYLEGSVDFAMPPESEPVKRESRTYHGAVAVPRRSAAGKSEPVPSPTRLKMSASLANRLPEEIPPGNFQTRSTETPPAAYFLVALSPDGALRHVVTDRSTGEAELDQAAMRHLRSIRFLPADSGETEWGFVEFQWGRDVQPLPAP
jgi:hypothetical protein